MSEILSVEKELGRVRESIETMQGRLKLYDSLVAYATVTLSLYETTYFTITKHQRCLPY